MNELGIIGYAAVAVLFTFLTILLLVNWRGQVLGGLLIAACVVNVAWAIILAAGLYGRSVSTFTVFVIEVLRTGAWLTFLAVLFAKIGAKRLVSLAGPATWVAVLAAGTSVQLDVGVLPTGTSLTSILNAGGLLMALAGLLLVEQLHRNTPDDSRLGIKSLMLGIGGIFVYDLFLYSQNLMLSAVEPLTWMARGLVNAALVPVIAFAVRTNKDWKLDIFVSRQVVFYTTTLAAVGVYLLLMSAVGYWIVRKGGTWTGLPIIIFFVGAVVMLVILLFSANLRARLRVFLSKHFFRNKYDYRQEWLRLISTLAKIEDSSARQIAVKALAQIVDSPAGMLWLLDEDKASFQYVSSYRTTDKAPDISTSDPLVEFIRQDGWLVDLEEFKRKPGIYGGLQLPDWLLEIDDAWLIAPLITRNELLGLVLMTRVPRPPKLNYEDRDLLKTVGNHVAVHLAQERTDVLLSEARQFEAYNRLTAFLMHDLNNLIAQQSLIVTNASKHKRNPDFVDDAMVTIANSVDKMKRVMGQLRRGEAQRGSRRIELKFVVSSAADRCEGRLPVPKLEFNDNDASIEADVDQFTMILTNLIRNAQDATSSQGKVVVSTEHSDGQLSVVVADDGCGMTPEFVRDHLFRPFDSTKGSQGMGIGAYQAREFARKMGGDLKVSSEVSRGTIMTIRIPAP